MFRGAVTAYATELKHQVLGVDATLLATRGAVDPQVAAQMAAGVRRVLGADWGIATTGVAGPNRRTGSPSGRFSWPSRDLSERIPVPKVAEKWRRCG